MRRYIGTLSALLLLAGPDAATAQSARLSDDGVESLIETVQDDIKEFEGKLDRDVRKGKVRGPTAEVDVDTYLDDFEENLERLGDRFKKDYSASAEALTVLNQAAGIQRFIDSQSPTLKGRSEWDVAKASLNRLAEAYGTTFPLPANASARRINDAELQQAADAIVKHSQAFRKSLKDAYTSEEKAALQTAEDSVDAVGDAAKQLKSRIDSEKPATGEAANLAQTVAAVETGVAGRKLSASATEAWNELSKAMNKIEQEFRLPEPAAKAESAQPASASAAPAAAESAAPAPAESAAPAPAESAAPAPAESAAPAPTPAANADAATEAATTPAPAETAEAAAESAPAEQP